MRILIAILLVLTLSLPAIADEGDIWLWKSHGFDFLGYELPVWLWEIWLGKEIFVHADYEGADGILYTSIQGRGSATSTVRRRNEQFYSGICLSYELSPRQVWLVSTAASQEDVQYDYWKNWGMVLDMMFGDSDRFFTNLLGNKSDKFLVCSEAVVKWFEGNGIVVSNRPYYESTPNDIYEWRPQ